MRYITVLALLALAGCAPSGSRCDEWIEVYERDIAAFEICKTLPQCEIDIYDIESNLRDIQKMEECKQELRDERRRNAD